MTMWQFASVGNVVGCINEVNQRRARLVLGWVTAGKPSWYVASQPTQPGHHSVDRHNEH